MADSPTFQIPKDVIEPIIQAHVASAVTAALVDRDALVNAAVTKVLSQKVDTKGSFDPYSNSYNLTFLQWVMREAVTKAAREAIEDAVAKHKEVIRECIVQQLRSSKSPLTKQLIEAMTSAFTDPRHLQYNLSVTYLEKERG